MIAVIRPRGDRDGRLLAAGHPDWEDHSAKPIGHLQAHLICTGLYSYNRDVKIAVVGAYGVGRTYRVGRFPNAGETVIAIGSEDSHGGKGSNQAVAAARLGAEVALFTAVGDDHAGSGARELWSAEGVDADRVLTRPGPTMTGLIVVEPSGENRIVVSTGALAALRPDDIDGFRPAIAAADLLIVSLEIPLDVALRALAIAKEEGVRTLLNPAPAVPMAPGDLKHVDVITPNQTETVALTGAKDDESAIAALQRMTTAAIVQTRGADGVLVVAPNGERTVVPAPVPDRVLDTTGAGDSFTAALGVALVSGLELPAAASWAAAAGTHTVQHHGVIPALPYTDHLPPLATEGRGNPREDTQ